MTKKLFIQAITRFLAGLAAVGMLLFIPAGTLHYPQGWLLVKKKNLNSGKLSCSAGSCFWQHSSSPA